jgi:hypothetical protein
MEQNWRPGDHILATDYATPCLLYYSPELGLEQSAAALDVNAVEKQGSRPAFRSRFQAGGSGGDADPLAGKGPSVPIQEFMEARSRKLEAQRDVQWTSVILFNKP